MNFIEAIKKLQFKNELWKDKTQDELWEIYRDAEAFNAFLNEFSKDEKSNDEGSNILSNLKNYIKGNVLTKYKNKEWEYKKSYCISYYYAPPTRPNLFRYVVINKEFEFAVEFNCSERPTDLLSPFKDLLHDDLLYVHSVASSFRRSMGDKQRLWESAVMNLVPRVNSGVFMPKDERLHNIILDAYMDSANIIDWSNL